MRQPLRVPADTERVLSLWNGACGRDRGEHMNRRMTGLCRNLAASAAIATALAGGAAAQPTITSFDCPGSTFSYASGIDEQGRATGDCVVNFTDEPFVRRTNGTLVLSTPPPNAFTQVIFEISNGAVGGGYDTVNASGDYHAYIRKPNGTYIFFDPPGSGGTFAKAIAGNWVAGSYLAGGLVGFERDPSGTITTFDPSGDDDTSVRGVNESGFVAGSYTVSAQNTTHGFLRDPSSGTITVFDVPGFQDVQASGISNNNTIVGGVGPHAFIRKPNGVIHVFDVGGSGNTTNATAISPNGRFVVGTYISGGMTHGFLRDLTTGHTTTFDPAGSTSTSPASVNDKRQIVGSYTDATQQHCFIYKR
jgi:hypothetical protein